MFLIKNMQLTAGNASGCFFSELLELSAYFQMQSNINVNVLTKVETIISNSILTSNFNDH